ncbi:hypothetical protein M3J09_000377 [Ascochyta lentis]
MPSATVSSHYPKGIPKYHQPGTTDISTRHNTRRAPHYIWET